MTLTLYNDKYERYFKLKNLKKNFSSHVTGVWIIKKSLLFLFQGWPEKVVVEKTLPQYELCVISLTAESVMSDHSVWIFAQYIWRGIQRLILSRILGHLL